MDVNKCNMVKYLIYINNTPLVLRINYLSFANIILVFIRHNIFNHSIINIIKLRLLKE